MQTPTHARPALAVRQRHMKKLGLASGWVDGLGISGTFRRHKGILGVPIGDYLGVILSWAQNIEMGTLH